MKLSDKIYAVEKIFTSWVTAAMGLVVFLDVIHRTASRERGLLQRLFGDDSASWSDPAGTVLGFVIALLTVRAALNARADADKKERPSLGRGFGIAAAVVVAIYCALRAFLFVLPNGLVWSQTLGLVLMLWIGLIGASMATHDKRHLASDIGSKVWPKAALPWAQAAGNALTALFCLGFAGLSVVSIRDHFGDWSDSQGAAGIFVAIAIPKWCAYLIIPTAFTLMAARFFALMLEGMRGVVEEDDAMQMLGLAKDEGVEKKDGAP